MYYVYMLRCQDGSLYTGYTNDYRKRIRAHVQKLPTAAKYTKSHPVEAVAALWQTEEKSDALRLEAAIKALSREEKLQLVENSASFGTLLQKLQNCSYTRLDPPPISDL